MKNFSLKALGALLFAAGLVVAGVAAPASAAVSAGTISQNTFTAGTGTPGFTYTTGNSASGWTEIAYTAQWSNNPQGFQPKSGCTGTNLTFAACSITSIQVGATTYTSASGVTLSAISNSNNYIPEMRFLFPSAQAGVVIVTFASGAWVPPQINGTYPFKATTNGSDSYTVDVTVSGAQSTVFMTPNIPNDFTRVTQRASSPTALTANSFTRSGYSFAGWATSPSGTVAYADGAQFNFFGPTSYNQTGAVTQLYAVWTQGGGGGGGSSASANLTINASTGQLVAGSTVAVVASGLQATAPYEVVVRSTPQTIGTGNAVSGAVNTSVTLPAGLEAGWHSLTFSSTAADGSAMTSVAYFKVSASGTLLATSTTIPAELANTGVDSTSAILLLAGGLSLALVGAEMFMIARRKRSN